MKKFIYIFSILSVAFFSSCDNKAIPESIIDPPEPTYDVNISVSLSDFFQSYDFVDTRHNIKQLPDAFRTFNSEENLFIQVRTLIYDKNGYLVDSILDKSTNTNQYVKSKRMKAGNYTAISTLTFCDDEMNSFWLLRDKESLNTVQLECRYNESQWSILSYDSREFTVADGTVNVNLSPSPIGALVYIYYDHFWTEPNSNNDTIDNGIRSIGLWTNDLAYSYFLNSKSDNPYVFLDDAGDNSVWRLSSTIKPSDFGWDYFKANIYDYVYILAPKCNIEFGYILQDNTSIDKWVMLEKTTIEKGKVYLAYWNYLYVGNPYFGIANNNIWQYYPDPTPQQRGIATTSHSQKAERIATRSSHLMNNACRIKMSR